MSLGLLFPGQGSQYVGMGRDLAEAFPRARSVYEEADEVLGFSLSRLAWEGPAEELVLTKNAQPAILTHSVATLRVVEEGLEGVGVGVAAGHSLGEFSAHVAAGTLSFTDAVGAVRRRGRLMHEAGASRPGSMSAILGLDDQDVRDACAEATGEEGCCVPANYNAPGQVVISGDQEAVTRAADLARQAGARRVIALDVSGAFHSPLMEPAAEGLARELEGLDLQNLRFPVVSNVTAEPVLDPDGARELLVRQLTSPVRWSESVARMVGDGVDRFVELGPGKVLCGLNRRNAHGAACVSLGQAGDVGAFLDEA